MQLISINEFASKHNLTTAAIYSAMTDGRIPRDKLIVIDKIAYIDEEFVRRRRAFRTRIWLEAHDNYYYLTSSMAVNKLAKTLECMHPEIHYQGWNVWVSTILFSPVEDVLKFRVPSHLRIFHKLTTQLIVAELREKGVLRINARKEIKKELDRCCC